MTSTNRLKAAAVGAGWAGEGHSRALQCCGIKRSVGNLLIASLIVLTPLIYPMAQGIDYTTHWVGNAFPGKGPNGVGRWVQDYIDEIEVTPDGAVITASEWDEAGRCTGIYKDGDVNGDLLKQPPGPEKAWGWGTGSEAVAVEGRTISICNTGNELVQFRICKSGEVQEGSSAFTCLLIGSMLSIEVCADDGGWKFIHQIVCPNVIGTDEVACGDVDGDGKIDIVFPENGKREGVWWVKNMGGDPPKWRRMGRISSLHRDWKGEIGWMGTWIGDFDGDGDMDVVSGAKGNISGIDRPVCWFENVKGDGMVWREHLLPVSGDHIDNCRSADFDGDGRDEIIVEKYHGGGVYYLDCPPPRDPRKTENWRVYRIGKGAHGLSLADVDGDGKLDVLVDNVWLKNPGDPAQENWPAFPIDGAPSGVKNAAGDLNGDGKVDIVLSSEEGRGIWWFEAPEDPRRGGWVKHIIDEDREGNHTLWLADFDRDGDLDILTAEMHTKGKHRVSIFENVDGGRRWVEHVIATTGSHNAIACDVDGDGLFDVVGCNFGTENNPLEVWYNRLRETQDRKEGGTSTAERILRFEAEDISEPKDAWQVNTFSETKWNLWSTDRDAMRKWSEGVVLQSPPVLKDRKRPDDGAPPLHSVVRGLPPGRYHVFIGKPVRPLAVSLDGKKWLRVEGRGYLGTFQIEDGRFEIWVDDRYASLTNPGPAYYDYLEFTPVPDPNRKPKVQGYAKERVKEKLDRGLVALPMDGGRIYIGWRLLAEDPPDIGFNLYRRTEEGIRRLNERPITQTTDFVDENPVPGQLNRYFVRPVINGQEGPPSKEASAIPSQKGRNYLSIKLQGNYTFQKCGIADLDGDGDYDFVIKQPDFNVDPYVGYWKPSPGTYKVEAYLNDGKFLWRYDLGWAIEQGIWYSPMIVYDLDGDGRAEVCLKTGEGDPRDKDGRVRSGPEYLTILDGMTGKVKAQTDWPSREGFSNYNYASRNQMCIAYLDGRTPCLIVVRGTYGLIKVRAYQFHDGRLTELWRWSSEEEGPLYRGQGAHSMHAVDVDEDGRDEVFLGSAVLDDNGCGLWSTGMGHPDHHYVGDIDPSHPGLEVYYGMETRQAQNGCCLVDAGTGRILWGIPWPTRHVHSRGMCADIDPDSPGRECYSSDTDERKRSNKRWLFSARGKVLRDDLDWGFGLLTVHWDEDPQKELIRGGRIFDYKGRDYGRVLEGKVVAIADVVGDWREEIIVSLPGELRIYTTTIPARSRHVCLMQDPLYRMDVAVQAMGYLQCPMTSKPLYAGR